MVIQCTLKWKEYPLNHPGKISLLGPVVVLVSGSIYVHGGFGTRTWAFYRVSLETRRWIKLTGLNYRYSHSGVLVDDKTYIFGGRSSIRNTLPIEAYDMVTNTTTEFEPCKASRRKVAYVESRRQVIIVGIVPGHKHAKVFGFNVDTGAITPYRTSGGLGPTSTYKSSLVVASQRTLFFFKTHYDGNPIFTLTLGRAQEATWSTLTLRGVSFLNIRRDGFQMVQGLLILFGHAMRDRTVSEDIVIVDPQNLEAVQVRPTSLPQNINYEGKWPKLPVEAGSVASNGKMWIVGGRSSQKIIELELERTARLLP